MRIFKLSSLLMLGVILIIMSGCNQELEDCRRQNAALAKTRADLLAQIQAGKLELEQLNRQLNTARNSSGIEIQTREQRIKALQEDLARKKELIARMQEQLLGGVQLPVELSTMLEDFANSQEMVTYDSSRGIVKFKSDLLFEKGSAVVAAEKAAVLKSFCTILNSKQGKDFDIIIAGHTDDIPIRKSTTRAEHPTNWHLSAHRAISVLNITAKNNIASTRMSIRGFGEFRPVAANKPGKKGNPQNRRVEIYIVPKGM